jgi:hypothetical protein
MMGLSGNKKIFQKIFLSNHSFFKFICRIFVTDKKTYLITNKILYYELRRNK